MVSSTKASIGPFSSFISFKIFDKSMKPEAVVGKAVCDKVVESSRSSALTIGDVDISFVSALDAIAT